MEGIQAVFKVKGKLEVRNGGATGPTKKGIINGLKN